MWRVRATNTLIQEKRMTSYTFTYGVKPSSQVRAAKYDEVYKKVMDLEINEWFGVGGFNEVVELERLQATLNSGLRGKSNGAFSKHCSANNVKVQTRREKANGKYTLFIRKIPR